MTSRALLALLPALLLAPAAVAGPADGTVVGTTLVVNNGSANDRFNFVIMGDGYRTTELPQFAADAQQFIDFLMSTPPFDRNCSAFNFWRVDVSSTDSGADDPTTCGGTGATPATYFDATFCSDGVIRRLLGVNNGTATNVANAQVPQWDQVLIIVNSSTYGGSGGTVGVTSVSGTWENIAVHEFGHSGFQLADEYDYYSGCGSGETGRDNHPAAEPSEANVTVNTDRNTVKWSALIDAATPVPTTQNADCTMCDPQGNPLTAATVGLYEGAHYYHCDAYRPQFSCMMRNYATFCAVCSARINQVLAPFRPANRSPEASAGSDVVAECSEPNAAAVTLNGSATTDADCDLLDYSWSAPGVTFDDATRVNPTGTFSLGTTTATLEVGDGQVTDTDTVDVSVVDTTDPSITCPADATVECTGNNGILASDAQLATFFAGISATDVCDVAPHLSNTSPAFLPLGSTPVTFTARDDTGNSSDCTANVEVADTVDPTITLSLDRTTLWPPNHRLVDITATVGVSDVCDPNVAFVLTSIVSDEPDNGLGDGDTAGDVQDAAFGTPDLRFRLRSERSGTGDGRVYTVVYTATDGSGNSASTSATVEVPHDRSGHAFAAGGLLPGGFEGDAETFTLVVHATAELDAAAIVGAAVGNTVSVIAPLALRRQDFDGDGLLDVAFDFPVSPTKDLASASPTDEPIGFRYETADGIGYLVPDLFRLGDTRN